MVDKKNNSGDWNSGNWNSGNWNLGSFNSGDGNSGDGNSGHRNSGNGNSGSYTSGDWNSGNFNSGVYNSGHRNSGYSNSGSYNSGSYNSGSYNSGNFNSGDGNSGHRNSGDFNSGDYNSGFFNTNTPKLRMFNEETDCEKGDIDFPDYFYFILTKWISIEDMSDKEKEDNPEYKTTEGYLKVYDYKEAWKISFNETCDKDQAEQTINLPNFDYDIFEEITGITKSMLESKLGVNQEDKIKDYKDVKLEDLSKESLISIIKEIREEKEK